MSTQHVRIAMDEQTAKYLPKAVQGKTSTAAARLVIFSVTTALTSFSVTIAVTEASDERRWRTDDRCRRRRLLSVALYQ